MICGVRAKPIKSFCGIEPGKVDLPGVRWLTTTVGAMFKRAPRDPGKEHNFFIISLKIKINVGSINAGQSSLLSDLDVMEVSDTHPCFRTNYRPIFNLLTDKNTIKTIAI